MVDYSLLILFTGFSFAAFQFWKLTVNNVITVTINKAIKNTHPWIGRASCRERVFGLV